MSGTLPAFYELSQDDRGPIVVVVGFTFVLTTALLAVIRTAVVVILKRGWSWDDACVLSGTVLALFQTALSERAVKSGLGRRMSKLDPTDVRSYYKFTYANQVLAIIVMALAKLSVLLLMRRLSPQRRLRRASHITIVIVVLWMAFSVLALALQCGLPEPWVYSAERCGIKGALWYPIVLLNILTDCVVALLFIPVALGLQMSASRQAIVCLLFGSRIVVCGIGIAHITILPSTLHARDQTWDTLTHTALVQVTMTMSMITAVIPSLSRFFSELQIGNGARLPETHYDSSDHSYRHAYELSNLAGSRNQHNDIDSATCRNRRSSRVAQERDDKDNGLLMDANLMHEWYAINEAEYVTEIGTQRSDHSQTELRP